MELVFAYLAGLLTLINPCVLPVLPIVLASGTQAHRHAPAAIALGMSVSFVILGMAIATLGYSLGLYSEDVARIGAFAMIAFGLMLLIPRFGNVFTQATSSMAARADGKLDHLMRKGLWPLILGGALLGVVWSPCIGPTLGGAIALASQGERLAYSAIIMVMFALGVSTIILLLGYGTRSLLMRNRAALQKVASVSKPITGATFLFVGTAILLNWHLMAEAWAVENLPAWLIDFSVAL